MTVLANGELKNVVHLQLRLCSLMYKETIFESSILIGLEDEHNYVQKSLQRVEELLYGKAKRMKIYT